MAREILIPARGEFTLAACPDETPGRGMIAGPTLVSLISPGTEINWAEGDGFPIRPGYSAVFRVESIGPDVSGVAPGDLRFCMGPHRSAQCVAARDTLPLPAGLSPDLAVLARLIGVSLSAVTTARARVGDRVVISGAGPVGFLAAHLCRIAGLAVTVIDPDPTRRAQAGASGLSDVRASAPLDDPAIAGRAALALDCSGHEGAVLDGLTLLRPGGEAVLVGVPWRRFTEQTAHEVMRRLFFGRLTLRGGWEWDLPLHGRDFVWEELTEGYNNAPHSIFGGFARALDWLAEGRFPVAGLIRRERPDDPATLYAAIRARQIAEPFILLDWTP